MGELAAAWAAKLAPGDATMPFLAFWRAARDLEPLGIPALTRGAMPDWLSSGCAPGIPSCRGPSQHQRYAFHHFIEYALRPLGEHLAATSAASPDPPPWSPAQAAALGLIGTELEGVVLGHKEHLTFDAFSEFLRSECAKWVPAAPS